MEKKKLTSFGISKETQKIEKILLNFINDNEVGTTLSKSAFHRNAIRYYLESENHHVNERLLISRGKPGYVERNAKEQVYLSTKERDALQTYASMNHCSIGTVFFHALLCYIGVLWEINIE